MSRGLGIIDKWITKSIRKIWGCISKTLKVKGTEKEYSKIFVGGFGR